MAMMALLAADAGGAFSPPAWTVVPYLALLAGIAVLPLTAPHFWHDLRNQALVAAACAVPMASWLLWQGPESRHQLWHAVEEYISFVVLLAALFTVAGGIALRGELRSGTRTNVALLVVGAILANLIGTTGASMVLIRPMLRANNDRQFKGHIPVFFIFLVSNLGGLLTPLGDPPLLLGYLRGVPFRWTLSLWREWLFANGLVLLAFIVWDRRAYRREPNPAVEQEVEGRGPVRLSGGVNILLLLLIVVIVLLRSDDAADFVAGKLGMPVQTIVFPWAEVLFGLIALVSLVVTRRKVRLANEFRWDPIIEVAVLFAGIFITMVPALALLQQYGPSLGLNQPWQYFWATGLLSSVLDNAPTYICMGTLAGGGGDFEILAAQHTDLLRAISCGAVLMGANTYIGNAPNFMVRVIAEESGYPMPSFFGYLGYSALILMPVFALMTLIFFR